MRVVTGMLFGGELTGQVAVDCPRRKPDPKSPGSFLVRCSRCHTYKRAVEDFFPSCARRCYWACASCVTRTNVEARKGDAAAVLACRIHMREKRRGRRCLLTRADVRNLLAAGVAKGVVVSKATLKGLTIVPIDPTQPMSARNAALAVNAHTVLVSVTEQPTAAATARVTHEHPQRSTQPTAHVESQDLSRCISRDEAPPPAAESLLPLATAGSPTPPTTGPSPPSAPMHCPFGLKPKGGSLASRLSVVLSPLVEKTPPAL